MIPFARLGLVVQFAFIFILSDHVSFSQTERHYLIKAGLMYDSDANAFVKNRQILIKGKTIVKVGEKLEVPKGTEVLDYSNATVTPGLIDAHTHILTNQGLTDALSVDAVMNSSEKRVLRAAGFAKSYLDAGFTTIRDLGNSGQYLDLEVSRAINKGYITGPRMLVSGPIIGSMDGQLDGLPFKDFDRVSRQEQSMVTGVDQARQAVLEHIGRGVDVIKILAIGNRLTLTLEEMKAIVETAHAQRVKVTAHCDRDWAVHNAIEAGVDGIEHGYGFKEATLELMAKKGVYLVPTYNSINVAEQYYKVQKMPYKLEDVRADLESYRKWLGQIQKSGVLMVAGSDAYFEMQMPRGDLAKQTIWGYNDFGISPENVMKSATANAAHALEMKDQIGVIKEGAFADIAVFEGDLQKDFKTSLLNVRMVMKEGEIHLRK
ncbi:amidohydrolase family protein [Dyadobacter sp. Leaf189]|uniref:amidohydrolase family protein n=1 Tax=Dyadobacter sp. Leaf189 TaxID=1736295 RepID=UPI0006F47856|nr:amidohydrolase family protein [Dyadobacter sp. Leaf189]KQS27967.1 hypothetical protein ASG33_16335 [Dyadobacter sp. Leaf189]